MTKLSDQIRAHPRVGGENPRPKRSQLSGHGSSPRGRGKQGHGPHHRGLGGLIPAWAGKTIFVALYQNNETAHPRVGGENPVPRFEPSDESGSSPRGRGKPWLFARQGHLSRLIPAWAGKTSSQQLPHLSLSAHPRVGGENLGVSMGALTVMGSSPRGRGKRPLLDDPAAADGLIPAWAGKTWRVVRAASPASAHPRVGGENGVNEVLNVSAEGSSPRGRGKHRCSA